MAGSKPRLANGEIEILKIMWPLGQCGVREVYEDLLMRRRIAMSTVAVRMAKMEAKGLIEVVGDRRPRMYSPCVQEQDIGSDVMHDLLNRLFNGSAVGLIRLILKRKSLTPQERADVRKELDKLK